MNGKYFYDGLDVLDEEFTAVEEKYGLNREDFKEGNICEELRDKAKTYFQNEASFLEADLKDDETLGNRFDVAAEDENGEL